MNANLKLLLANPLSEPLVLGTWGPQNDQWLERADGRVVRYGELVKIADYRLQVINALLAALKDKTS